MYSKYFNQALTNVLIYEGGYVNNPNDKGGETNKGITKQVYDRYRSAKKLPTQSVAVITLDEVQDIYYNLYWTAGKCNELPIKLAIVHFDTCVNLGITQANKLLQRSIGVADDGVIGAGTLAKIKSLGSSLQEFTNVYIDKRCEFYINLVTNKYTQIVFLKGWMTRCRALERLILTIA
jgi:lysozyme family protein